MLPQHSPEIFGRLRQRALRDDVCTFIAVTLQQMIVTTSKFRTINLRNFFKNV